MVKKKKNTRRYINKKTFSNIINRVAFLLIKLLVVLDDRVDVFVSFDPTKYLSYR